MSRENFVAALAAALAGLQCQTTTYGSLTVLGDRRRGEAWLNDDGRVTIVTVDAATGRKLDVHRFLARDPVPPSAEILRRIAQ